MFKGLYRWTLSLAESPAPPGRWARSRSRRVRFSDPAGRDPGADVLAKPKLAWRYAAICTVMSVLGGILGYAIGALLYDTVGQWLIGLYGYGQKMEVVREAYAKWGALFILVKGLSADPVQARHDRERGAVLQLPLFVLLSLITRGARFFIWPACCTGSAIRSAACWSATSPFHGAILFFIVFGFWIAARLM